MADAVTCDERAAPLIPTRKPVAETAAVAEPVVTEQIIQTGEETPPPAEAAAAPQAAEVPSPVGAESEPAAAAATAAQAAPRAPRAFAFAAAMNSARPAGERQAESRGRAVPTAA